MKLKARLLIVILTLTLVITSCVIPAQAAIPPQKYGDVDSSGYVDIMDVTAIQNHLAHIENIQYYLYEAADVNGDASINIYDATIIQRYIAGYIDEFPSGKYFFIDKWLYHVYPDYSSGRAIAGEKVTFTADGYASPGPDTFKLYINGELVDENSEGNTLSYTFEKAGTYSVKVCVYDKWGIGGGYYTSWSDEEYVVVDKPEDLSKPYISAVYRENIHSYNLEVFTNVMNGTKPYQYKYTLIMWDKVQFETDYSGSSVFSINVDDLFENLYGTPLYGLTLIVDVKDANGNTDSYTYDCSIYEIPIG